MGLHSPNLGSSLPKEEARTIGLIVPDSADLFFTEVCRLIEDNAFEAGLGVILCNTHHNAKREKQYINRLIRKQVDGVIFIAAGDRAESLQALVAQQIPVVVIERDLPNLEVDVVLTNNRQAGYRATQHLISLGHRRVACIGGPSEANPSGQRVVGYRDALAEAGLPLDESLMRRARFDPAAGRAAALALLQAGPAPSAIFACSDLLAIGVLSAAAHAGRSIPADLAVVGFDNIDLAAYFTPPLTTVAQPKAEIARTAVRLLAERMEEPARPVHRVLLAGTLIVRASCGGAQ